MRLQHVRYQYPIYDDDTVRWIICGYVGEGFLDLRIGRHRWRLHPRPASALNLDDPRHDANVVPCDDAALDAADPSDESTWDKPCWNCGHVPGCEWQEEMGYACCPKCFAD